MFSLRVVQPRSPKRHLQAGAGFRFPQGVHIPSPSLQLTATELLQQYVSGDLSAEAVVTEHLRHIKSLDASLQAWECLSDSAVEDARAKGASESVTAQRLWQS